APHRRQQLLQPQVPHARAALASSGQPEPERRAGHQRIARPGIAHHLRVVDRLSAALLAGRARRGATDACREPAAARGRRGPHRAGADLSARVLAARYARHPRIARRGRAQSLVPRPTLASVERAAMMLLLLAAALDWFHVYQYTPKAAALRGCSECKGEPDDLCE